MDNVISLEEATKQWQEQIKSREEELDKELTEILEKFSRWFDKACGK